MGTLIEIDHYLDSMLEVVDPEAYHNLMLIERAGGDHLYGGGSGDRISPAVRRALSGKAIDLSKLSPEEREEAEELIEILKEMEQEAVLSAKKEKEEKKRARRERWRKRKEKMLDGIGRGFAALRRFKERVGRTGERVATSVGKKTSEARDILKSLRDLAKDYVSEKAKTLAARALLGRPGEIALRVAQSGRDIHTTHRMTKA